MKENVWLVTERGNIFITYGTLILIWAGLRYLVGIPSGDIGLIFIAIGVWQSLNYKWEKA